MKFGCACGATKFQAEVGPLFRILCHCTICQRFNGAPFADVLVFAAQHVSLPPSDAVNFDRYKPPPNVKRGKCASCNQAAIEVFITPILPKLVMVPTPMLRPDVDVPEPVAHIFYEKRLSDAEDRFPKHQGFLRSQFAFMNYLRLAKRQT